MQFETDYLVVGAGATGLAFADALVESSDAELTLVDRRSEPGGHWRDTYPFVRLHTPSSYYGVNSLPLGDDRIDQEGENAGFYERATGEQICEHFERAVADLDKTGQVRFLSGHEYLGVDAPGEHQVRSIGDGARLEFRVRRKVVDARYLEPSVPATHTPSFEVGPEVKLVPVGELPASLESATQFTVLGAGKTAVDACVWLLDQGVDPERIRWVRPREAWFNDRAHFQPLEQVGGIMEGLSLDAEAGARATDVAELFASLEDSGRMLRIERSVPADMYRGTMLSLGELESVRRIEDVVRMGRVRKLEADRIVLERGEVSSRPEVLHIDCTATGLNPAPAVPVFGPDRIVLQQVRHNSPTFNAALVGFVEATFDEETRKNRLCPPNPYASTTYDWPRMMSRTWKSESRWLAEPELNQWLSESRLNLLAALPAHANEPATARSIRRFVENVAPAIENLDRLSGAGPA